MPVGRGLGGCGVAVGGGSQPETSRTASRGRAAAEYRRGSERHRGGERRGMPRLRDIPSARGSREDAADRSTQQEVRRNNRAQEQPTAREPDIRATGARGGSERPTGG